MRTPEPTTLSGNGVVLEPLTCAHVPELLAAAQDDDVRRWMPAPRPRTADELQRLVQMHPGLPFAVIVAGHAQGSTSCLDVDLSVKGLEVGWTWYARPLWATT